MIVIRDIPPLEVGITLRRIEERVCYRTEKSNRIILNSLKPGLSNESIPFQVRKLSVNDYKISHRYSILVHQYLQSISANEYFSRLNSFSKIDAIFTQIQTGFLTSNISSQNEEAKVLGYFEVSSVDSARVFFNYEDLFPNQSLPPYIINCNFLDSPPLSVPNVGSPLIDGIKSGLIKYAGDNPDSPPIEDVDYAPYLTTLRICGDCTVLGSNVVPDFWEE